MAEDFRDTVCIDTLTRLTGLSCSEMSVKSLYAAVAATGVPVLSVSGWFDCGVSAAIELHDATRSSSWGTSELVLGVSYCTE